MARRDTSGYSLIDLAFAREARRWAEFQKDADKAKRFALRKLGRSLPVAWRKDIQGDFNLPAKQIRERIDVRVDADSVLLIGRRRPIGLINFGGRWPGLKKRGSARRLSQAASAQVRRGGPRIIVDDGFIATGKSGNRQIFQRRSIKRLPIRAVYGPSVVSFFRYVPRQERMYVFAAEVFRKELARVRKFV